jgi:hypothetical protein
MGHTDARMTLGVYAQLLKLGPRDLQALERVIRCSRDEARALFEAEDPRAVADLQFPNDLRTGAAPSLQPAGRQLLLRDERPGNPGLFEERLKGLEPSTFCMANITSRADWLWKAKSALAGFRYGAWILSRLVRRLVRQAQLVRRDSQLVRRPDRRVACVPWRPATHPLRSRCRPRFCWSSG